MFEAQAVADFMDQHVQRKVAREHSVAVGVGDGHLAPATRLRATAGARGIDAGQVKVAKANLPLVRSADKPKTHPRDRRPCGKSLCHDGQIGWRKGPKSRVV